jgi:L-fuculose-phosphate aldolase
MSEAEARREVITRAREMAGMGLAGGTSGNLSRRWGEGFLITPSGIAYGELTPGDIVAMSLDGTAHGQRAPSSEWRIHRDIFQARPEVGAIVHTHSLYATTLAIAGCEIPALHYMIAAAGGPTIRCAPYATYGSQTLSDHALAALAGRMACLLAHHGVLALGDGLTRALWLAGEVETLAHHYYNALALTLVLGKPAVLPDAEIARVVEKFRTYGPKGPKEDSDEN